jgi:CheY-like chemotaxis protein
MSGYELASTLRARGIDATLFAVSGYGQVRDRTRSGQAGFDQHCVKPLAPHLLLQAVGRTAAQQLKPTGEDLRHGRDHRSGLYRSPLLAT